MIAADTSYFNGTELLQGDSPELVLVPATPRERIESIRLNSKAWKGRLDLETYITRENHLLQQPLTKDGLTCWILVDRREPEEQRTILGSCETYKKKAILAYAGKAEDVSTHGVGSVYCRPDFRGKGYAKRMMEELSNKIETWKMETETRKCCLFTILFSDIGKDFYAQFGWQPFTSSHFALSPMSEEDYASANAKASLPKTRTLAPEDVRDTMCNETVLQKERELLREASEKSSVPRIAIAPNFEHFEWHWAREEFYAERFHPDQELPRAKGAGEDSAGVYCAWNRNFGETPEENTLYILRWVYDEPTSPEQAEKIVKAMAAILRRAQLEAHRWNMATIEFWNPTPLLEKAVAALHPNAELVHRQKSSIACLRWTGAEHGMGANVEWHLNEKYAWC
ncbi:GNAT family acetyltransferase [Aspergillus sclerotiicarbonarius CBS 121057]|uniref:GNAT family acetyltransferase n=1 Tax=Aspergillus sclerotiicarbonarius (strain CBS 121057 / IBT 28362) TaxID=1448318 RepID=A0A319E9E4_ASPSB|nr:GNAT family acetyltransferase [Aspergillus sclerotiicarbonarius CBS 121057]